MIIVEPFSPIAFSIGPIAIRWYALAYVVAFILGFWMLKKLNKSTGHEISSKSSDDLFTALVLGVIIGGRLGYVLFYNLPFFISHPLEIFAIWHGGMSFHGGLIGVIVATFLFARKNKIKTFSILDKLAVVAPIGLFFGRIANFINMEVMGRITNKPWGIVFAGSPDMMPRHPSPLYEAALEGLLLFIIMLFLWRWTKLKNKTGALSGIFAVLYGVFRIFVEQFRQPDAQLGFLIGDWLTMGMLLSAVMIIAGVIVFAVAIKKK
ncbi:MAG: prolipoprotein diacylglyceryl transferase [Alphaproteobacteria bacterium]|jgi:phosphatidylglycerol:prolipoprotein diacylglycerol transferase